MSAPSVTRARGGGTELGYASITASASTTSTSGVDVAGLSVPFTGGVRPVIFDFGCRSLANSTASDGAWVFLQDGATVLNAAQLTGNAGSALLGMPGVSARARTVPTPGTAYTYKIVLAAITGGTATIAAGASSAAWCQITEV